ncbi:Organic solute transporter subunit alpha/Transmembrane protein [Vigna unguiculata]|uniref:Organic solute transporter subunit alpha/Transmembrane protein n=1 Tax=Vigna unguiculata TaxID=3917 RepID=A0A4D6NIU4_VIGUN|nr:Organic solute transporter subunit alpha/Transmembrane protein [Vigna unguiculata]
MAPNHFSNFEGTYKTLRPPAAIIAACSVLEALVLSFLLILQHLQSYNNPAEQKWIVGVVSMVPIYATESIISLWNPKLSLACDILRNCYEAFALYSFGRYLIAALGGEGKVVELLEDEYAEHLGKSLLDGVDGNHDMDDRSFCNFFWHPAKLGKDLLTIEKFGLVQYMILKTVCALLAFILEQFGVYGDGEFKWYYGSTNNDNFRGLKNKGVVPCIAKMAVAAVAHVFVFSAKPYHFLPSAAYGELRKETKEAAMEIDDENRQKTALLKETSTRVESPRTSVTESVQDIVVEGGQRVVEDVVLAINQAIGPVEKGVTRIQQTFHHRTVVSSDEDEEKESDIQVERDVTES